VYVSEEVDEEGLSEVDVDVEEVGEEVDGAFGGGGEGAGFGEAGKEEFVLPYLEEDVVGTDSVEQPL
jgi:hypothetical protein